MVQIDTKTDIMFKENYQFVEHIFNIKNSDENVAYIRYFVFKELPELIEDDEIPENINFIKKNTHLNKKNIYLEGIYLKEEYRTNETIQKEIIDSFQRYISENVPNSTLFLFKNKYQVPAGSEKIIVFERNTQDVEILLKTELSDPNKEDAEYEYTFVENSIMNVEGKDESTELIELLKRKTELADSSIQRIVKKMPQLDNEYHLKDTSFNTTDNVIIGYGRIRRLQLQVGNSRYEFGWNGEYLGKM